ncbi:MAG: hypothetical protein IJQ39_15455 [Thermoguttaceae bacterium]|nr:hypothetical protein [Thermoguttaceae bacterium]
MTNHKNIYGNRSHRPEITERLQKDIILEGMNFCQRRNDSIKRAVYNSSGGKPFDLNAAWQDIVETCAANEGKTYTESTTLIGSMNLSGTYPLNSAVLAPGGFIYLPPYMDNKIYKIDTNMDTVSVVGQVGEVGVRKYTGAVYAPDGCIYAIPSWNNSILKIDPRNDAYETFGEDTLSATSYSKWAGACALPDGRIFGIPFASENVLVINIYSRSISTFGSLPSTNSKWDGGILSPHGYIYSPQGYIYGIPSSASTFLKINPQTLTTETFGTEGSSTNKFAGPTLCSNGKIYCLPWFGSRASVIDPNNDSVVHINTSISGSSQYEGSVLAPNGNIYCSPCNSNSVAVFNPANNNVSTIYAGTSKYRAGVLSPNGYIYFIPNKNGTQPLLKVNPGADVCQNFKESTLLSPFLNKY